MEAIDLHLPRLHSTRPVDESALPEPGAGYCNKVRFLLARARPTMYVPMDISAAHLRQSARQLATDHPWLPIHAICVDHTRPFDLPTEIPVEPRVFFYPGSSLGNFDPPEAIRFLRDLFNKAGAQGRLLIGIDTKKAPAVLHRAYNDAARVTAAFNLNLLRRLRQEFEADLELTGFDHHAFLWALAGQLDVPGGLNFRMKEGQFPQNRRHLQPNPDLRRALGRDRFPVYSSYRGESHAIALPAAVLHGNPYRVRALLVLGASLITSWPDPELWSRTLGALDLLVCIDRYLTADAAFADIVLPATTMYEITSFMRYGPIFKIRERLVEPQGEARNDFLILAELARRLGYGHLYPQTEEAILEQALEGTGFTVAGVRAAGG